MKTTYRGPARDKVCTEKESPRHQGHRGEGTTDTRKHSELPLDRHGVSILDAAGLDVLRAYAYFRSEADEPPAIVAALLVVAWAIRGRP